MCGQDHRGRRAPERPRKCDDAGVGGGSTGVERELLVDLADGDPTVAGLDGVVLAGTTAFSSGRR